jgi:NH3-dependent NAD+ synthetase
LPEEIVKQKASGCSWGATAEEEWGFTEDDLDAMLEAGVQTEREYVLNNLWSDAIDKFLKAYRESSHKRSYYPIYKKRK